MTATALLSLALGIGATTAVFSVVDALFLRPLPAVHNPRELVLVEAQQLWVGGGWRQLLDGLRRQDQIVAAAFAWTGPRDLWMYQPGAPPDAGSLVAVQDVTGGFIRTLGAQLLIGPGFDEASESMADGAPGEGILSFRLWQRQFDMDPEIVGDTVVVDEVPLRIVGVAPRGFRGADAQDHTDLWRLRSNPAAQPKLMARLQDGRTRNDIEAALALLRDRVTMDEGLPRSAEASTVSVRPGWQGWHPARAASVRPLIVLAVAAALVFLVSCANAASLMLAQGLGRRGEFAVRAATGASRRRLMRQLTTESALLVAVAGVAGALISVWASEALLQVSLLSADVPNGVSEAGSAVRVVGFVFVCGVASVLFVGLLPSITLTGLKTSTLAHTQSTDVAAVASSAGLGRALVAGQVALALVLLISAGLCLRTLSALASVDIGFATEDRIYLNVDRSPWARQLPRDPGTMTILADRLRATPGIDSVATMVGTGLLLAPSLDGTGVLVARDPISLGPGAGADAPRQCALTYVGPGFFSTMGIELLAGREFRQGDPGNVAIVSRALEQDLFGGGSAIGRSVHTFAELEVVGVVRDTSDSNLRAEKRCTIYQLPRFEAGQFVLAVSADASALTAAIPRIVTAVDETFEAVDVRTFAEIVDDSLVAEQFVARFSVGFGLIALLIAAIGLYGVVSNSVSWRVREIGIRTALGATPRAIAARFVFEIGSVLGAGLVIGYVGSLATGRLLSSLLFGVPATDAVTLVLAGIVLSVTAAFACALPIRRATRIDPVSALRL